MTLACQSLKPRTLNKVIGQSDPKAGNRWPLEETHLYSAGQAQRLETQVLRQNRLFSRKFPFALTASSRLDEAPHIIWDPHPPMPRGGGDRGRQHLALLLIPRPSGTVSAPTASVTHGRQSLASGKAPLSLTGGSALGVKGKERSPLHELPERASCCRILI